MAVCHTSSARRRRLRNVVSVILLAESTILPRAQMFSEGKRNDQRFAERKEIFDVDVSSHHPCHP